MEEKLEKVKALIEELGLTSEEVVAALQKKVQNDSTVAERIRQIIADRWNLPEEAVTDEANLAKDLMADSLDIVELIMALEKEFKISVPDSIGSTFVKVGDIINWVEKTLETKTVE